MTSQEQKVVFAGVTLSVLIFSVILGYAFWPSAGNAHNSSINLNYPDADSNIGTKDTAPNHDPPPSSDSVLHDGWAWRKASFETKQATCRELTRRFHREAEFAWVTSDWLYHALNAYYQGNEPAIYREKVTDIAGLCVAMGTVQ